MLRNASAMTVEREALRMGIEHLTVLFPTEVSSFDFQVECRDGTVQYKLNAQSLRLFGLHRDVNDAHRASANRLQNKTNTCHYPIHASMEEGRHMERFQGERKNGCGWSPTTGEHKFEFMKKGMKVKGETKFC